MSFIEQTLKDIATDKNIDIIQREQASIWLAQITKGKVQINPKTRKPIRQTNFLGRAIKEFELCIGPKP